MSVKYETVIFDMDGTMLDSAPGILKSMRHTIHQMGYPEPPQSELRKFLGPPLRFSFEHVVGMDSETAAQAVKIYRAHYAENGIQDCALYPGVDSLLRDLQKAGVKVCLATSKIAVMAQKILVNFNLTDVFYYTEESTGAETNPSKSAKVAKVLEVTGTAPERAVMIGDTKYDAASASENKVPFIGVLYGYGTREEMRDAIGGGVDECYVETVAELRSKLL
ncbi:HAD hydrolase-like protein [Desulfovibrio sp. OttesenSCG-928-C06]|nr:HAD hydrolase-like protein [Desulfovibrio sp. OttesenSCG-928-C06]